jgi:hypothetical protein
MTTPRRIGNSRLGNTGLGPTGPGDLDGPEVPPLDPEEVRQQRLLAEAVLISFGATPAQLPPFGKSTLAWEITMPTSDPQGVSIEVHLTGVEGGDDVVAPKGTRRVLPYGETRYGLYLRAPLATRNLGNFDLAVDGSFCFDPAPNVAPNSFASIVNGEIVKRFPPGGQLTLREGGPTTDIGYNSFVVDVPLKPDVPGWFDPDVDVEMGFSVRTNQGRLEVTHDLATTKVSFGAHSSALSLGCSAVVAEAVEQVVTGFLYQAVGVLALQDLRREITNVINRNLERINALDPRPPVAYVLYDLTLTAAEGLTLRCCPGSPGPTVPTPLNGNGPTINS